MKRAFFLVPLLGLAPLGHFLGSYLEGAGILPGGTGFFIGAGSMFLLPWPVAAVISAVINARWPIRILLFIGALVVQFFLFAAVPAGATSEMMGIAHRFRQEFPPDQLRACAARLRQKYRDGTLAVRQSDSSGHSFLMTQRAVLVADSELPDSLRGRFQRVFIQPDTGDEQVFFSLGERTGIVCDGRKDIREFFVCSMADGVHAYRYQRL